MAILASVGVTCSVGPRLFVVNPGQTAGLQNGSALARLLIQCHNYVRHFR